MEVSVIIEPVSGNGYRVTGAGGLSVGLTAEGATAAEAVERLVDRIVRACMLEQDSPMSALPRTPRRGRRMPGTYATTRSLSPAARRWKTTVAHWTKIPTPYEPLRAGY